MAASDKNRHSSIGCTYKSLRVWSSSFSPRRAYESGKPVEFVIPTYIECLRRLKP